MKLVLSVNFKGGRATSVRYERVQTEERETNADRHEAELLAHALVQRAVRFKARGRPDGTPPEKN